MKKFILIIKIVLAVAVGAILLWDPLTRIMDGRGRFTTYFSILGALYFAVYIPIKLYLEYRTKK